MLVYKLSSALKGERKKMRSSLISVSFALVVALVLFVGVIPATAGATLSDQNLAYPGVYYGSGNVNGGWTVNADQTFGVELGLRAKLRYPTTTNGVIHSSSDTYSVPTGVGGPALNRALWNYDFSIALLGTGGITMPDITATLTVTDMITGQFVTVDPMSAYGDNVGWGFPNLPTDPGYGNPKMVNLGGQLSSPNMTVWGAQNSQNPAFGNFPLTSSFDATGYESYRFDLSVTNNGGQVMATDTMFVNAGVAPAPEPATMAIIGGALVVLGVFKRRATSK